MVQEQVQVLGVTTLVGPAGETNGFGGAKPRQLLELLALEHGLPLTKERLAEALWQGSPPSAWAATLESYVAVLRRAMASVGCPRRAVATVDHGYLLSDAIGCDLTDARMSLDRASSPEELLALARTPALGRTLLPSSPYADWAVTARSAWEVRVADLDVRAAEAALVLGEPALAVVHAARAWATLPWSETAAAALIRAHTARGDVAQALMCFAELRERLQRDLGVAPGPAATEAYLTSLHACDDHGLTRIERALLQRLWHSLEPRSGSLAGLAS